MPASDSQIEKLESPWLTMSEVAVYLSVSPGTVRNWVSQRFIPFSKRGGLVRFHQERIDQWLLAGACKGRRARADERTKVSGD